MTVRASLPGRQLCVFEGDTEVIEGLKIRHTHQKKKEKEKASLDVGPCRIILFRLGFGTFSLTQ